MKQAKANRVLSRKQTGDGESKYPLPTTLEMTH